MTGREKIDKLAREVCALKYVECSLTSWRGYKILFDEIAFAYLSKLKDNEEKREEAEEDRIRQREVELETQRQDKVDRDFLSFLVLSFAMLIFAIVLNVI